MARGARRSHTSSQRINRFGRAVASGAVERSAISSKIMELIFSADFAFRLIDQTLGNAMFGNTGPHEAGFAWINDYYWDIVVDQYPGLMWALNLLWCFMFILVLRTFLDYIMALQMDARLVSAEVNLKGDVSKFYEVMSDKMFVPNFRQLVPKPPLKDSL